MDHSEHSSVISDSTGAENDESGGRRLGKEEFTWRLILLTSKS